MNLLQGLALGRARSDFPSFAGLCLRDEVTGQPVKLAPHHRAMARRWTTSDRSVSLASPEMGKSSMAAAFVAWRLGRDPSLRILLVSGTREQAARLLRAVAIVMNSPAYCLVFPDRTIERLTADELTVSGRPPTQKDVSVTVVSYELSSALGTRTDLAVCDDLVSRESTRSQPARDRAYQDFLHIITSRMSPDGEIHVINTSEHSDDIPHRLARLPGWTVDTYPALDDQGKPTWPERWPAHRIEQRRLELGPAGFRRAMLCQPIDEATQVFAESLISQAMAQGVVGLGTFSPIGGRVVIGVDPAWTVGPNSDETGIVMVTIDSEGFRHLVHVEGVRLTADALVSRLATLAKANRATCYVESNAAGAVIAEQLRKVAPQTVALPTTASSKAARVEWLNAELAAARWAFRNLPGDRNKSLERLCEDLLTFSFEGHTGDRLSALLLATEGARRYEQRPRIRYVQLDTLTR